MNVFVIAADVNETALAIFGVVVAATLAITYWASKRMTGRASSSTPPDAGSRDPRTVSRSPATTCRRPRSSGSPG